MSDKPSSSINLLDDFPKEIKQAISDIYDQLEFIFHLDGIAVEKLHQELVSYHTTKSKKKVLDSLLKTLRDHITDGFSEVVRGEFNSLIVQLKDIGAGNDMDSFKVE